MSSYVNWYIKDRDKENNYVYFDSHSRSSDIYHIFQQECGENVDEQGRALGITRDNFKDMIEVAGDLINSNEAHIKRLRDSSVLIMSGNNSLDDKMEYIAEYNSRIEELQQDIRVLQYARCFFEVLLNAQYGKDIIIYGGIEAVSPNAEVE